MITDALRLEIESAIGCRITSIAPLSAANNAQIQKIGLEDGRVMAVKVAENDLAIESWMLGYLREKSALPVPQVYYSNDHVMVMDYVPAQEYIDDNAQAHAAELLAALHQIKGDVYGLERDTHFWSLPQINTQTPDWVYFYGEHRLMNTARTALAENRIDSKMMKQVEKLCGKLTGILKSPAPPSLIHGDVWSGNILAGHKKIIAFLDPAIYYADPEIELAYIRQFNSLQGAFFSRYHDLNPIRPGFFEERADVYALYPLLVHARIFGASYTRKAQKILDRFVG